MRPHDTLPHVLYHMYCTTCTVPHVLYHMYYTTCTLPHVLYHMYCTTCTIPHVLYHMYCTTCTIPHVLYCMYCTTCMYIIYTWSAGTQSTVCHTVLIKERLFAMFLPLPVTPASGEAGDSMYTYIQQHMLNPDPSVSGCGLAFCLCVYYIIVFSCAVTSDGL